MLSLSFFIPLIILGSGIVLLLGVAVFDNIIEKAKLKKKIKAEEQKYREQKAEEERMLAEKREKRNAYQRAYRARKKGGAVPT